MGLSTSTEIWTALKHAYSHSSVEQVQSLRGQLRQRTMGSSSVFEFGSKFKGLCDYHQQIAIRKLLDNKTPFEILYSRVPNYHNF
uniref:Uncharacterized protein n=1 Tax=Lactuca sativa TaxID=4236 RepID=A0A9R1XIW8_LACSA|nr:hypothetical protein LSAT_V11C400157090 [Lactuca sativa]